MPPVALRKESVDRNFCSDWAKSLFRYVALRKESVDRNQSPIPLDPADIHVALRKESVDRNPMTPFRQEPATVSLSARRAWIEIPRTPSCF